MTIPEKVPKKPAKKSPPARIGGRTSIILRLNSEDASFLEALAAEIAPPGLNMTRQDVLRTVVTRLREKTMVLASRGKGPAKRPLRNR